MENDSLRTSVWCVLDPCTSTLCSITFSALLSISVLVGRKGFQPVAIEVSGGDMWRWMVAVVVGGSCGGGCDRGCVWRWVVVWSKAEV